MTPTSDRSSSDRGVGPKPVPSPKPKPRGKTKPGRKAKPKTEVTENDTDVSTEEIGDRPEAPRKS